MPCNALNYGGVTNQLTSSGIPTGFANVLGTVQSVTIFNGIFEIGFFASGAIFLDSGVFDACASCAGLGSTSFLVPSVGVCYPEQFWQYSAWKRLKLYKTHKIKSTSMQAIRQF